MTQPTTRGSATQTAIATLSSITQAHTTVAGDDALTVHIAAEDGTDRAVTAVTFNGDAMTKIAGTDNVVTYGGVQYRVEAYLLLNPDIGAFNVVVTFAGSTNASATIQAWLDVTGATAGTTSSSPTPSLTPSFTLSPTADDIVVGCVFGAITAAVPITTTDTAIGTYVRETYFVDAAYMAAYATDSTVNFAFTSNDGYIGNAFVLQGVGSAPPSGSVLISFTG